MEKMNIYGSMPSVSDILTLSSKAQHQYILLSS